MVSPQVAQARTMGIGKHQHCCITFKTQGFVWEKKPIVSVTYKNERILIENSLLYLKCVLRLSCVVHRPIYGRFMGFYVNAFLFHKNPYILNVMQQCRCSPMLIFRAWATSGFSTPDATGDSFYSVPSGLDKPLFAG